LDGLKDAVNSGGSAPGGIDCRIDQRGLSGRFIECFDERSMLYVAGAEKEPAVKAKV
jgi:hypothetical protein